MTQEQAIEILKNGGTFVELAEAIGIISYDADSSLQDIMLGLKYGGFVQEQAALALYKKTGLPLPKDRRAILTDPQEWNDLLAERTPMEQLSQIADDPHAPKIPRHEQAQFE